MGFNNVTFNLTKISAVNFGKKYQFLRLLVGIVLGIVMVPIYGIGFILILWGLCGIKTHIAVSSSGATTIWPVMFWETQKAKTFISQINRQLADIGEMNSD